MSKEIIDVADLDCIFLTYDEPKKEEFWIKLQNMVPWAKRVDGVQGSDAAHKAAARESDTERFILIDGDNIPDAAFFNKQIVLDDSNRECVFRWKARNEVNGLMYGNGGISCWTKDFVMNMQTHEASTGSDETDVEFCFDPKYWAMAGSYSTTYPNGTPFQAWRAGFREGVKMSLNRGKKPTLEEFKSSVVQRNMDNLTIWHNVGMDAENGNWAIYGARLGTKLTMLSDWNYKDVQDFSKLAALWEEYNDMGPTSRSMEIGKELTDRLGLPIVDMNAEQSKFFKHHYRAGYRDPGIMARE